MLTCNQASCLVETFIPPTDVVLNMLVATVDIVLQRILPFQLLLKIMEVTRTTPAVVPWVTITKCDFPCFLEDHKKKSYVVLVAQQDAITHP